MKLLTAATTLSLVYGAAASCSDYDNEVKLMDQTGADSGGTFHYTLGDEDIMGCVHNPEEGGWTAIGFSSNGKMLAEDGPTHNAIIGGFVETGPMKFDLTSKAFDGSGVTPSASQTLTNASYELSDSDVGGMVLKFTKKLEEEGEVPIKTNGENKIIFSWGQPMDFHTVYSHVKVNFMAAQDPPEPETNDGVDTEPQTDSCSDYDNEVKLMDQTGADTGGTLYYTLGDEDIMVCVHNPTESEKGIWTAIGFSSNGKMLADDGPTHNSIIGGWTDTPMKFDMTSQAFDGSGVTPSATQTLTDASYLPSDDEGMVLKFTKKLEEDGEVPIKMNGENKIIFSWGEPMSFHSVYSHVKVNFMAAQDPPEPETNDEVDTEAEVDPMDSGAVNNVLAAGTAAMAFVTAAML